MAESPAAITAVTITDALVKHLLASQMPDLAHLEIGRHYRFADHVSVRVGDQHGLVLPLEERLHPYFARAADLIAPHLSRFTFTVSAPIRTGQPDDAFPLAWVLVPWREASTARYMPLQAASAAALGKALKEVHTKAPAGAPSNPHTSSSLESATGELFELLERLADHRSPDGRQLKVDVVEALWHNASAAEGRSPLTWTHGNIHPHTVLSDSGGIAGLALWHFFGAGNPCVDLGQAALLVPTEAREDLLRAYGATSSREHAVIQGCELLSALRHVSADDPFNADVAWHRLDELELLYTP